MKKKLTVVIALILLLALCATLFVGCDEIFKLNEARDANQIVATVHYEGQSANVYKFELASSFNTYGYYYAYYYGMSYEAAADYIVRSLAQQKLLGLYAKEKIAKILDISGSPANIAVKTLLTNSEYDRAIDNVNDSMLSRLKSLISDAIKEDNYNNSSSSSSSSSNEKVEVTDPVYVRFDTQGGSEIERVRLQKGTKVQKPDDPTREGYTFYGWYKDKDCTVDNKFDFENTNIDESVILYAKWVKYLAPRTERPEAEEEDDYDPEAELAESEISKAFFTAEYQATLYDELKDDDCFKDVKLQDDLDLEGTVKKYISDAVADLKTRLTKELYKSSAEECYAYYLDNQMESLLITKLEREIGKSVSVTKAEVESEFQRVLDRNTETFGDSVANYESALKSSLTSTYLHTHTDDSYGFVINILLKLDDDSLNELTEMLKNNPKNKTAVKIERNRLLSKMMINVSNPEYKSSATVEYGKDKDGKEIEILDPMTDPNNKYNNIAEDGSKTKTPDTKYQKEGGNNYDQMISFEKDEDNKYGIVYNISEAPTMAYMLEQVPAFDIDGKVGVIHQIYKSFEQVSAAVEEGMPVVEGVYWMREVATAWLYLVGDDSGSVSSDSNNGGLGYLVSPEGEESSFLTEFTDYARELIDNGTGNYCVGEVDEETDFLGVDTLGNFAGDKKAFVVADSFIESGSTSNAYAGVFVLMASYKAWDEMLYNVTNEGKDLGDSGVLPTDYYLSFAKDKDDAKTVYQLIEDSLLTGKKADVYNLEVNTMGLKYSKQTEIFKKAYKSLWKDLDK